MDPSTQAQLQVLELERLDKGIAKVLQVVVNEVEDWQKTCAHCGHGNCGQGDSIEDIGIRKSANLKGLTVYQTFVCLAGVDRATLGNLPLECCTKLRQVQTLLRNSCIVTKDFADKIRGVLEEIDKIMHVWRQREQKRRASKGKNPVSLDTLMREIFQKMLPLILNWRSYAHVLTELNNKVPNRLQFPTRDLVDKQVTVLASRLLNQGFVVLQSPSVLKLAKTGLVATLLFGDCVGVDLVPSKAAVAVLWEEDVQRLSSENKPIERSVSVMPLEKCVVDFSRAKNQKSQSPGRLVIFKHSKPSKVKRKERSLSVSNDVEAVFTPKGETPHRVAEEVCYLVIEAVLSINGGKAKGGLDIPIRTLSLPMSGSSHGSQDGDCDGHVMWYYAFGVMQPGGWISAPPKKVSLKLILETISLRFEQEVGKGLHQEEHKSCLRERLMGPDAGQTDDETTMITIEQFCESKMCWKVENKIVSCNFSFWTWVYKAMNVIKFHLKPLWGKGYLGFGFIRGKEAEALLEGRRPKTYFLRFSYSRLGGISASVVRRDGSIFHMEPLDYTFLKFNSVLPFLRYVEGCAYLYPETEIPDSVIAAKHKDNAKAKRAPQKNSTVKYQRLKNSIPQPPKPHLPLPSVEIDAEELDELLKSLPSSLPPRGPESGQPDPSLLPDNPAQIYPQGNIQGPTGSNQLPPFSTAFSGTPGRSQWGAAGQGTNDYGWSKPVLYPQQNVPTYNYNFQLSENLASDYRMETD